MPGWGQVAIRSVYGNELNTAVPRAMMPNLWRRGRVCAAEY